MASASPHKPAASPKKHVHARSDTPEPSTSSESPAETVPAKKYKRAKESDTTKHEVPADEDFIKEHEAALEAQNEGSIPQVWRTRYLEKAANFWDKFYRVRWQFI